MNFYFYMLCFIVVFFSCKNGESETHSENSDDSLSQIINKNEYELHLPNDKIKTVLMLFGGYPENAEDIKREFNILEKAQQHDIAVVLMNYNQKLWLDENEKSDLAQKIQAIFIKHKLPADHFYIGGFSSGGVVNLLISDYIIGSDRYNMSPKGVFVVDSPIDLVALYNSSEKNIERNFSDVSVQESTWLIDNLESEFGKPEDRLEQYEKHAVYTHETGNISNLSNLNGTKIRLYTEPDTTWWKENRMADYDQTNAFYIKALSENLVKNGYSQVEYIPTKNKGYRADGERHPHSWSIVDVEDLLEWMVGKS